MLCKDHKGMKELYNSISEADKECLSEMKSKIKLPARLSALFEPAIVCVVAQIRHEGIHIVCIRAQVPDIVRSRRQSLKIA